LEESKLLLDNYQRLYSFSKKINLELFKKTNESHYLKEILNVHESIIYSRIQSQFNYRNDIRFKNLPKEILLEEQEIKKMLITALEEPNPETGLKDYYESSKAWDAFNENLRINHPKYYELKYGFNQKSLAQMLERIPDNTSVVRYIFIDEKLYAFVLDQKNISLHPLTFDLDSRKIEALNEEVQDKIKSLKILHELYVELWEPFEDVLNTKRVTIVPDGNLFNLSFESLTRSFCDNFRDMKSESLIADYILSYNYSINLIDKNAITIDYGNNFIGFAPGFDDSMKERYQMTIQDSISIDKTYLTLLPQPHSLELTKDFSKHFNGSSYLNEKSTEQVFKERAKEHKIIHIGTHAESNNITPELSRLIFAKEITDSASSDDNSLYTFEIYNTNLSANLAILTACETGKPTYQAGEGMISLAHAFNYAGSESILTSLWKIDELSTAEIIHEFYNNISNGLDKDEALQKAKLSYLEKAEGREMDPEYWAGLVLIGDTSPIVIGSDSNSLWYWILGVVLIILLLYFL